MTRWTVRRECGMFWDEDDELCYGPRWHVTSPMGWSWGNYPTHAEALAYADKQARTRKVVLPRLAPQGEVTVSATWDYDQHTVHYIDASGQTVQGTPAELRPLALALLALAEKEEYE